MTASSWSLGASLALLALCVTTVVARPGRLPIAVPVAIGAGIALATGLEPLRAVGPLWGMTWDAVATLLGLMVLSSALDRSGFFTWSAGAIARLSGGAGARLWWGLMALACLTSMVLANDGAMLILVPLYVAIARNSGLDRRQTLALLIPTCFLIDIASVSLSTSNLTNLMLADDLHIPFVTYARMMAVPSAATIAACLVVCWGLFGRRVPLHVDPVGPPQGPDLGPSRALLSVCGLALGILAWGLLLSHVFSWPISAVVGVVALGLLAVVLGSGRMTIRDLGGAAPWPIAVFALGMFVLVDAVARNGGTTLLLHAWGAGGPWRVGATIAVLASGLDNLPALLMSLLGFAGRPGIATPAEVGAVLVAADVGCKLTPYGSLATLLWLRLLADRGVHVQWREYLLYGLALTPLLWGIGTLAALAAAR